MSDSDRDNISFSIGNDNNLSGTNINVGSSGLLNQNSYYNSGSGSQNIHGGNGDQNINLNPINYISQVDTNGKSKYNPTVRSKLTKNNDISYRLLAIIFIVILVAFMIYLFL
jgi:hypothetical protein